MSIIGFWGLSLDLVAAKGLVIIGNDPPVDLIAGVGCLS